MSRSRTSVGSVASDLDRRSVASSLAQEPLLHADVLYDPEATLSPTQPFTIHLHNNDSVVLAYKVSMKHPERYTVENRKGLLLKGGNALATIFMKPPVDPNAEGGENSGRQERGSTITGSSANNRISSPSNRYSSASFMSAGVGGSAASQAFFVPPANPPEGDLFQVELRAVFAESLKDTTTGGGAGSGGGDLSPLRALNSSSASNVSPAVAKKRKEQQQTLVKALMAKFDLLWDHSISVSSHKVPARLEFITPERYTKHLIDLASQRVAKLQAEKQNYSRQLEDYQSRAKHLTEQKQDFEREVEGLELESLQKAGVLNEGRLSVSIAALGILGSFILPLIA